MIVNQMKTAIRTLRRDRTFTALNLMGLTLGVTACLLLLLSIEQDLGYDKHFDANDRIYRITSERTLPGAQVHSAASPRSLGPFMTSSFSGGEAQTRFSNERASRVTVSTDDELFIEEAFRFGEPSFFDVFEMTFLHGTPESALVTPFSVVLSRSTAERYFPSSDPMGRSISVRLVGDGDWFQYVITGVIQDLPEKTHFALDALATYEGHPLVGSAAEQDNWLGLNLYTYIRLREDEAPSVIESALNRSTESVISSRIQATFGLRVSDENRVQMGIKFSLQPITSIHLRSHLQGELHANRDFGQVLLMGALSGFILLLACINFVNLSTARVLRRMKLVGVRQALGASRNLLIRGFLLEAFIVSFFALVVAVLSLHFLSTAIGGLIGIYLVVPFTSPWFFVSLLILVSLTTLFAGLYPALVLSRPRPVQNLLARQSQSSPTVRSGLVIVQFVISTLLIIGTLTVKQQLDYMQAKQLGYNPSGVVVLEGTETARRRIDPLKQQILALPGVQAVGTGQAVPGQAIPRTFVRKSSSAQDDQTEVRWVTVTENYIETLEISLLAGRSFQAGNARDSVSVIINQEAARILDLRDPIGSSIFTDGRDYEVIGVVGDYHFEPLHTRIEPMVLFGPDPFSQNRPIQNMLIRYSDSVADETLASIQSVWQSVVPEQPFRSFRMSDRIGAMYPTTDRMNALGTIGALFALIIASLGLIGLAASAVDRKQKEIGVRKVLGATALDTIRMLVSDLMRPVLFALLIAVPVGWVLTKSWLNSFAYHPPHSIWIIAFTVAICFFVALISVIAQGTRAAHWAPMQHLNSQ